MKKLFILFVLALGVAAAGSTVRAADEESSDELAVRVPPSKTLRVRSQVDDTCRVWVDGTLRATIGPFGDTGILSTLGTVREPAVLVHCNQFGSYQRVMEAHRSHCDFSIAPRARELTPDRCI